MIIAVDYDDTLKFTKSEVFNYSLISKLKQAKQNGHKLILWTCRGEEWLEEAIEECKDLGLEFDAVNENVKGFNYTRISCKVVADLYIDDKAPGSIDFFRRLKL